MFDPNQCCVSAPFSEQKAVASAVSVVGLRSGKGQQCYEQQVQILLPGPDAVEAPSGDQVAQLALCLGVLFVGVGTAALYQRDLLIVPVDTVLGPEHFPFLKAGVNADAVAFEVVPDVFAVKGKGGVVVDQQRIPLGGLLMAHQMGRFAPVLVVNKLEACRSGEGELRHLCLIENPAVLILDAVAVLGGSQVREKTEAPLLIPPTHPRRRR